MVAITGTRAYVVYGWEDTFGSEASTKDKTFGAGVSVGALRVSRNIEALRTLGKWFVESYVARQFTGTWSVNFRLANPWWLQAVFNTVSTSGSEAPYTHEFTMSGDGRPKSMSIEVGMVGSENVVRKLLGAVVTGVSITARVNATVNVRLNGAYRSEVIGTTLGSGVDETMGVYTFADGSVLLDGTEIGKVQSFDIDLNPNIELIWGLGDAHAQDYINRVFEAGGRMTVVMEDASYLNDVIDATEHASIELNLNNGSEQIKITLNGIVFGSHDMRLEPEARVDQDLDIIGAKEVKVTAINNEASPK